ncbi:MAG: DUF2007 domain-containing protein [Edaphobacter sp.]
MTEAIQNTEEYVTVAEFIEPVYAQLAKGALESAGIECFLQGEHINNLQMGAVFAAALQVHRQDEEAARAILDAAETESGAESEAFDTTGGSDVQA